MTIGIVPVSYKCDVCKRSIKLPRNSESFEVVSRCIITQGCEGRLHKILNINDAMEAEAIPPSVEGLTNWLPRKVLFTFTQPITSTEWLVQHNLGGKPIVQTFVEQLDENSEPVLVEVVPQSTTTIDLNTTLITFATAQKGVAQFISIASANTTNQPTEPTISLPDVQITSNSFLTIATIDASPSITMSATFYSTSTITFDYISIDASPSIQSPWVGINKIFVGGKRLTVRSFDIREHPLAFSFFSTGQIVNGSQFFISGLTGRYGDNLILLAKPPFSVVDRIRDQYIDLATINQLQPEIYYNQGQAFAKPSIIRSTYPPIINVV